jgi:hypothetical protein
MFQPSVKGQMEPLRPYRREFRAEKLESGRRACGYAQNDGCGSESRFRWVSLQAQRLKNRDAIVCQRLDKWLVVQMADRAGVFVRIRVMMPHGAGGGRHQQLRHEHERNDPAVNLSQIRHPEWAGRSTPSPVILESPRNTNKLLRKNREYNTAGGPDRASVNWSARAPFPPSPHIFPRASAGALRSAPAARAA